MTTITIMQSRKDYEFAKLTDQEILERYFEMDFFYDSLGGLTDNELDDWVDDYVAYLPETHNIMKEDIPSMLGFKLKRLIRERM
jgi:hypothetical protein